jgi:hypothetical protein
VFFCFHLNHLSRPRDRLADSGCGTNSSIPRVYTQSTLQGSAAPNCLVFLLFLQRAQKLAKATADSRQSTADLGRLWTDRAIQEIYRIEKEDSCQKREHIQMTTGGAEFLDLQGQNTSEIS